ncbi:Retinol dehydrogenase 11 [Phlyctema vagabunda]|uniref:Retinol dehydrogenase 11 n=1 Tax=Phlyctema vagabunda TaxID=108571 RepID=A0ABR4P1I8_9HELO
MAAVFSFMRSFIYSQLFVKIPYPTTDFSGKTVIVTGANTGLGFEAAKHFVRLNAARVIIAVRNVEKGEAAKQRIEAELPEQKKKVNIQVWQLDLSSYQSVQDFAARVLRDLDRLDVLLENAGIGTNNYVLTEGTESTLTTNVFSTELLALLLLPKLQETASRFNTQPVISIVSSDLHFLLDFPERNQKDIFESLNVKDEARMDERYQVTKLIEIFFVRTLASKINNSTKPKVIVNCMTPGACHSDFFRDDVNFLQSWAITTLKWIFARTTEVGARTLVTAASAGPETHGTYMADSKVAATSKLVTSAEGAELEKRLWDLSLERLERIVPGVSGNI